MSCCTQYSFPALTNLQKHTSQAWIHLFKMVSSFFWDLTVLILFCKNPIIISPVFYTEGDVYNFYAACVFKKYVTRLYYNTSL